MSGESAIRRRVHEIKEAINTLRLAVQDVAQGYRFDDDFAGDKIRLMQQSVAVLERESEEWVTYLRGQD